MIVDEFGNRRFFGVYRGIVQDNADPLGKDRLKLQVPQVLGDAVTGWSWAIEQPGFARRTPAIGEGVYVVFEGGDPSFPIWSGSFEVGTPFDYTGPAGPTGATGATGATGPAGGFGSYGAWHDNNTQTVTSTSTGQPVLLRSIDLASGFSVVDNSKITAVNAGTYNFAFSFQFHNTGGGGSGNTVEIWMVQNGIVDANSNTKVTVPSNAPYVVAAWNFFTQLSAGGYMQIYWATDNTHVVMEHSTSSMGGPDIPSAIVTVNQVG